MTRLLLVLAALTTAFATLTLALNHGIQGQEGVGALSLAVAAVAFAVLLR